MILSPTANGWRCITQSDHASLSREILSLWRTDGFPNHPRREELLEATLEHDNGWQEADSAPRLNAGRGCPHEFTTLPPGERLAIWDRGIQRHRQTRPYVAALILEHALHLHRNLERDPEWAEFLGRLLPLRQELLSEAGRKIEALESDYCWLRVADALSLTVCAARIEPFEYFGVTGEFDGEVLSLEPFPLAGTTTFSVACRFLPREDWCSDLQIAVALAGCRWEQATFRIAAQSPA